MQRIEHIYHTQLIKKQNQTFKLEIQYIIFF